MKIYVNGCSHSKCHLDIKVVSWPLLIKLFFDKDTSIIDTEKDLLTKSVLKKNILTTYSKSKYVDDQFYRKNFLKFIEDKNDYLISEASDAKGNDSILYETMESLRYLKNSSKLPDLCIIQWSGHSRNLISPIIPEHSYLKIPNTYINKKKPEYFTNFRYCTPANEYCNNQLPIEPAASLRSLNNMVILQDYLKLLKINYIFINYFPLDSRISNLSLLKELDLDRFVSFNDLTDPLFKGWLDSIVSSNGKLNKDPQGHPNINGMKLISSKVIKKYNET